MCNPVLFVQSSVCVCVCVCVHHTNAKTHTPLRADKTKASSVQELLSLSLSCRKDSKSEKARRRSGRKVRGCLSLARALRSQRGRNWAAGSRPAPRDATTPGRRAKAERAPGRGGVGAEQQQHSGRPPARPRRTPVQAEAGLRRAGGRAGRRSPAGRQQREARLRWGAGLRLARPPARPPSCPRGRGRSRRSWRRGRAEAERGGGGRAAAGGFGAGHGVPQAGQKPPALQPGVPHPQPRRRGLLPGALRPRRAHVRDGEIVLYHYGLKDLVTILFYIFIAIILHAVVQEYALDKINRRLHLSKIKHSKFNESGQLVAFHIASMAWCLYVLATEGYLSNPKSLWENYPHVHLPFQVKFFYLCQLSYWLHALPELYFQKVRKEEIARQLQYISLYLVHIAGAYLLNLTRLGLILLLLQYVAEFLFHMARLFYFTDENNEKLFNAWAVVFVVSRLFTLTLSVLVIGFGLARVENQAFDPEKGNFNTLLFRMCVLLLVCFSQAWMMWRFIHFQLRRWREYWNEQSARKKAAAAAAATHGKQQLKTIKRESGYHENGVVKAENGTSPRTKKIKSP
uniref:Translocation associated membrane protein 2 n=1 Tax=Podarcis muralis TaxID=64176 RepID=A0A670HUK8_PODMU